MPRNWRIPGASIASSASLTVDTISSETDVNNLIKKYTPHFEMREIQEAEKAFCVPVMERARRVVQVHAKVSCDGGFTELCASLPLMFENKKCSFSRSVLCNRDSPARRKHSRWSTSPVCCGSVWMR